MELDKSYFGYGNYKLKVFEFENGTVLNDVNVEYYVSGTPKYDDEGNVVNAIIYCHSYNGNCFSINDLYRMVGNAAPFDKDEYFNITITTFGFPDSCSPSSTDLKFNFPTYTVLDMVNFKRQFLREFLGIEKIHGLTGRGFGGYEVYTWACEYPDEMDFIMVADSSFKTNGYRYAISKAVESIIDSSEGFYDETYNVSLSKTMVSINMLLYSNYFSKQILQEMSNDEIDVLMDDFVDERLFRDIYDLKYRNDVILDYDIEDKLHNINVPALIFGNEDDIYYSHKFDSVPLGDLIEDSEIIIYQSRNDGCDDYTVLGGVFEKFLAKIEK